MSALGQEQTSRHVRVTSVIPLKADIHQRGLHVRKVPQADNWEFLPGVERTEAGLSENTRARRSQGRCPCTGSSRQGSLVLGVQVDIVPVSLMMSFVVLRYTTACSSQFVSINVYPFAFVASN